MSPVDLSTFDNSSYHPGRSFLVRTLWYFVGLPILRCSVLPISSVRCRLLRLFGARIGKGVVMHHPIRVKYPWHLYIGDNSWIGEDCWIDNLAPVTVGSNVCLSQGVYLCTGNHDWSKPSFDLIVKPITLGDGSWVGAKAVLAPGVTLGEGSIAAAGSVVLRDLPAYEVHAGNPAFYLRKRVVKDSQSLPLVEVPVVSTVPN